MATSISLEADVFIDASNTAFFVSETVLFISSISLYSDDYENTKSHLE